MNEKKIVLVPVDGSTHARKAIEFAADWAKYHNGKIHFIHVPEIMMEGQTIVLGGAAVTLHAPIEELEKAGQKVINQAIEMAKELDITEIDQSIEIGDPAKAIVAKAKAINADLIVIGSRGLGNWASLLVGSVSHKVTHLAPCTCVTVR